MEPIKERMMPYPIIVPAPVLLTWAHFKVWREGCPLCGDRPMTFLGSQIGPGRHTEGKMPSGEPFLFLEWEDIRFECPTCNSRVRFRFKSPSEPTQSYEEVVRSFVTELVNYFAVEHPQDENIPDYLTFQLWFLNLLRAGLTEDNLKGVPVPRWILNELERLAQTTSIFDENPAKVRKSKLIFFAVHKVFPEAFGKPESKG